MLGNAKGGGAWQGGGLCSVDLLPYFCMALDPVSSLLASQGLLSIWWACLCGCIHASMQVYIYMHVLGVA